MPAIELRLISHATVSAVPYQHLRFKITTEDGVITPQDLQGLKLPEVNWQQGIAI